MSYDLVQASAINCVERFLKSKKMKWAFQLSRVVSQYRLRRRLSASEIQLPGQAHWCVCTCVSIKQRMRVVSI